jgi:putative ABC transport system permease protein
VGTFLSMLAIQSLRHYWRLNLCLGAGVFLASAVLTGSLVVGDSVKETLRRAGELRIGKTNTAVIGGERFFTEALARENGAASVFMAEGSVANAAGEARANQVQILGVDDAFWQLAPETVAVLPEEFAAVSASLARQLQVKVGDTILARMEMPSAISKDAPLSGSTDSTVAVRKKVTHVIDDASFGRFSLKAEQEAPMNLFLPLSYLQERLDRKERRISC